MRMHRVVVPQLLLPASTATTSSPAALPRGNSAPMLRAGPPSPVTAITVPPSPAGTLFDYRYLDPRHTDPRQCILSAGNVPAGLGMSGSVTSNQYPSGSRTPAVPPSF